MPQPTRSTALAPITTPVPSEPLRDAETRATVYCSGCHGSHGIDPDTRARWLRYVGITDPVQLEHLDRLSRVLDEALRTVGLIFDAQREVNGENLDEALRHGQELIEMLDAILAPTAEDLGCMDEAA